jgi:hypothetical protein
MAHPQVGARRSWWMKVKGLQNLPRGVVQLRCQPDCARTSYRWLFRHFVEVSLGQLVAGRGHLCLNEAQYITEEHGNHRP